jgi:hypothetical protein
MEHYMQACALWRVHNLLKNGSGDEATTEGGCGS